MARIPVFLAILTLFLGAGSLRTARAGESPSGNRPQNVPPGLEEVRRPPLTEEETGRVRALVDALLEDLDTRERAGRELLALGWKAVPLLEETRWKAGFPLAVFVDRVLNEMPLAAFARDGEFVRLKDGMVMVWVPPGDIPTPNWALQPGVPPGRVPMDGFFIDRFCVTNRMFARFLNETWHGTVNLDDGCEESVRRVDGVWVHGPGRANHPVWDFAVGWYLAYARWAGALLPTGAMWERAAGTGDGRWYPWGNAPCTQILAQTEEAIVEETVPVWWFPGGDSPFGLRQMTGNVLEYVLDNIDDHEDPLVILDEGGGNPIGFNRCNLHHHLLKGGGVDEGERAYPIRSFERM